MSAIAPGDKRREIILDYGKTGSGKSRYAKWRIRQPDVARCLILDPQEEYVNARQFGRDLNGLIEYVYTHRIFRVATSYIPALNLLCGLALGVGNCWVVVEECARVLPARGVPPPEWFSQSVFEGRHRNVSMLMAAQRPTKCHIDARAQWTQIVAFNQSEDADVSWLEEQAGESLDLKALRIGHYYDIRPDGVRAAVLRDGLPTGGIYGARLPRSNVAGGPEDHRGDPTGHEGEREGGGPPPEATADVP